MTKPMLGTSRSISAGRYWAWWFAVLGGLVLWLALPGSALAQTTTAPDPASPAQGTDGAYVPGEIIVGFRAAPTQLQAASALAGLEVEQVEQLDVCGRTMPSLLVRVAAGQEEQALALLRADPNVEYAERNGIVWAAQDEGGGLMPAELAGVESPYFVDDPLYAPAQWDMQRSNFSRAWQLLASLGKPLTPVRVAVIDSGVDFDHPDLAGQLLPGYNYIDPTAPPADDAGHGTHVAGTIAALTNNGQGVTGGARSVEILPLKVLRLAADGTTGSISDLASAICDAADQGARVINLSMQYYGTSDTVRNAADYAYSKGALLIVASGNNTWGCSYFASLPNVLAVGALTVDNRPPTTYGCTGPEIDIAAGGGDNGSPVVSTWPAALAWRCSTEYFNENGAGYCGAIGTSMATPHVTAAAALLLSLRPALTQPQVETVLKATARPVGLPPETVGAGLLDAAAALRWAVTSDLQVAPRTISRQVRVGAAPFATTILLTNPSLDPLSVTGVLSNIQPTAGGWVRLSNVPGESFSGILRYGQPGALNVVISSTHLISGSYSATVFMTATRSDGRTKVQRTVPISLQVGSFPFQTYLPIIRRSAPLDLAGVPMAELDAPSAASIAAPGAAPDIIPADIANPEAGATIAWEKPISPTIYALGEGGSVTVDLPFSFPFEPPATGGQLYTQATIHADGFISFDGFNAVANPGANGCLSVISAPRVAVFGWWADLDPGATGAEVATFQPGIDRFVVQYKNVPSAAGVTPSYKVSLQIVLYSNGNVRLNYGQVPQQTFIAFQATRPLATIGAQAEQGLFFNQVACHTATTRLGTLPITGSSLLIRREDLY